MYRKRKPNRLPGFDYSSPGYYFVTICTENKRCIFGKVVQTNAFTVPKMVLNDMGQKVLQTVEYMAKHSTNYAIDHYAIMPNHIHMIIKLEDVQEGQLGASVPDIIRKFKSYTTHVCNRKLWQRSYHDRVIRDEAEYLRKWEYVEYNTAKWSSDELYVEEY